MIAIALRQAIMPFNVASLPVALAGMAANFGMPPLWRTRLSACGGWCDGLSDRRHARHLYRLAAGFWHIGRRLGLGFPAPLQAQATSLPQNVLAALGGLGNFPAFAGFSPESLMVRGLNGWAFSLRSRRFSPKLEGGVIFPKEFDVLM
jgi:hypothetical protein